MEETHSKKSILVSKAAVQQIRRGTVTIAQTPLTEAINCCYGKKSPSGSHSATFLDTIKKRSVGQPGRSKILRESRFQHFYRGIYSVKFTPEEDKFVTAYGAGSIQLWDLKHREDVINIKPVTDHGFPIMSLEFIPSHPENNFFAGGACGTIFLCDLNPDSCIEFAREQANEVNAVGVNIGADTLASGGKDATIRLYDINTGKIKHIYTRNDENISEHKTGNFHKMRIFALRFHHEFNDMFLTGGWDGCVKVWDMRIEEGCVRQIRGPLICGNAIDIKSKVVLTGSWTVENSLQIWDLGSTKLIDTVSPINRPATIDGEFLYCAQYFKGDNSGKTVIAGGSGLGQVYKSVQAIDTTQTIMVFGGMESTLKIILVT